MGFINASNTLATSQNRFGSLKCSMFQKRRIAPVFGVLLALSGCNPSTPTPTIGASTNPVILSSPIVSTQVQTLSPNEMRAVSDTSVDQAYVLGPSDVISIQVYQHPELTVPPLGGGNNSLAGALITGNGMVALPLIGTVQLGGLTLDQAQQVLTQNYAKYINQANVTLTLQSAQSLRYYLLGDFTQPGIKYPVHTLTLLEALALGGSVDLSTADLYQAYVAQGNAKLPIDLHALLVNGDLSQNITLASNDVIVIPTSATENAFVFGAIAKPGVVPFQGGHLSLLQALSVGGLDLASYTSARLKDIRVIRSSGNTGQFIIVDANAILQGTASSFDLEPGDIVFVPPTPWASWNQDVDLLLPSLQAIAGILNPFVSIKFLSTPQ